MDNVISWAVLSIGLWISLIYVVVQFAKKNGKEKKDIYIKMF